MFVNHDEVQLGHLRSHLTKQILPGFAHHSKLVDTARRDLTSRDTFSREVSASGIAGFKGNITQNATAAITITDGISFLLLCVFN